MKFVGLAAEDIITLNQIVGGPGSGVLDRGGIASVAGEPFQTFDGRDLYPGIWTKAAVLLRGLITTQYFADGNKRTAWAAAESFIEINGEELDEIDDDEAEAFALEVVAHQHDLREIADWLLAHAMPLTESLDEQGACDFCGAVGALPGAELIPRIAFRTLGYVNATALQEFRADATADVDYSVTPFRPDRDLVAGVCGRCRRGWMSLIDKAGFHALVALDQGIRLSSPQIRQLCCWAVKTALLRSRTEHPIDPAWRQEQSQRLRQLLRVPWGWSVWAARTPGGQLNLGRFTFCRVEESGITSPDDARKPTTIQFTHEAGGMLIVVCFDHPDLKDKWAYEGLSQVLEQERIGRLWPNPESAHPLPLLRATDVPLVGGLLYELIKATQEGE